MDESLKADLVALSRDIHGTPELAYKEFKAVAAIEKLLNKYGHQMSGRTAGSRPRFGHVSVRRPVRSSRSWRSTTRCRTWGTAAATTSSR